MIEQIISENQDKFTDKGLKFSVLRHYFKNDKKLEKLGVVDFVDGTKGYLRVESKAKDDADILQSLLFKALNFDTPSYMPVDLENGKTALIRNDLAKDEKSLLNSILKGTRKINVNDLVSNTVLAEDFHNIMNKNLFIFDLKEHFEEAPSILERILIKRELTKSISAKSGNRPIDAIFTGEYNRFVDFFEKKAQVELIKARLIRMATFTTNNDLKTNLYNLNVLSAVDKVIPISSGVNEKDINLVNKGRKNEVGSYRTEFSSKPLSLEKTVKEIKNNEKIERVFSKEDRSKFTNELWTTSAMRLARDYEDMTNYSFSHTYKSAVESQKDKIGEMLR